MGTGGQGAAGGWPRWDTGSRRVATLGRGAAGWWLWGDAGQRAVPVLAADRSRTQPRESPDHPPKRQRSPGRRFPASLPGMTVCLGMGRRKNMMGNREMKITPVKTGCWKAGREAGLQGCLSVCLSAEHCREEGHSHTGAVWGETCSSLVFVGPQQARRRQRGSACSQNTAGHGCLHKCVHSPSLNTCPLSFSSDEGHKPFLTTHQPGIVFI